MGQETYSLIAGIMKYWFILLILFILYRTLRDVFAEYKEARRDRKDAYYAHIGYLEVVECSDERLIGAVYGIRRSCYIGRGALCDIRFKLPGLSKTECYLYAKGGFVFIRNMGSENGIFVDDVELMDDLPLRNGSYISLLGVLLLVKLKEEEKAK
jgi:hypothetical protein